MTAAHTPGPWRIERYNADGLRITIVGGDGVEHTETCVARIEPEDDNSAGIRVATANANLIAVAPELLATLRDIAHGFERGYTATKMHGVARAALAKAGAL